MSLLRMPFGDDSFDEDLAAAIDRHEADRPGWTYDPNAPDGVLLATNVFHVWSLKQLAAEVPAEILKVAGADIHGVPPIDAQPATARSTWTLPTAAPAGGYLIPAGTEVELVDGDRRARFEVAADVTIAAGATATAVGAVTLDAVAAGADGNDYPAQTANLVDSLSGPPVVTTIEATAGGVDAEDDDTYVARLVEQLQVPGAPILADDFAVRARSVAGVARAVAVKGMDPSVARNETQTITIDATGGTWTASWDGEGPTVAVDFDATAAELQAALEALSNIYPGDVIVTGGPGAAGGGTPYTVEFTGTYRYTNVAAMTTNAGSLTGGAGTAAVATTQAGVPVATSQEGMVAVALADADGDPVASPTKTAVEDLLEDPDQRIVNVVVHVIDASYTRVDVAYAGVALAGYDPDDVQAAADAALADYLDPALWGATTDDPAAWTNRTVVRHQEISHLLHSVDGFDYWASLTINGAAADLTLTGVAPLPSPVTITGTVTAA